MNTDLPPPQPLDKSNIRPPTDLNHIAAQIRQIQSTLAEERAKNAKAGK